MDNSIFFGILIVIIINIFIMLMYKYYVFRKYLIPYLKSKNKKIIKSTFKMVPYKTFYDVEIAPFKQSGTPNIDFYYNIYTTEDLSPQYTLKIETKFLVIENVELKNKIETIYLK